MSLERAKQVEKETQKHRPTLKPKPASHETGFGFTDGFDTLLAKKAARGYSTIYYSLFSSRNPLLQLHHYKHHHTRACCNG
jgi:hypothetical protein